MRSVLLLHAALLLGGCASIAVALAPKKHARVDTSAEARAANARFWGALHSGDYTALPGVIEALQAVYLANPNDPDTTAHLGFAHVWQVSERARRPQVSPTVTDEFLLAERYFGEAVELVPHDARFRGFYGAMMLTNGTIHGDEGLTRKGYFALKDAVRAWPEFNLFTMGYTMSQVPRDKALFHDALEQQWRTLDLCAGAKVDRPHPDFARYMARETTVGEKRACWNSWIAPHNFEGFFLAMGDMLVKDGQPALARQIYANAKLSKTYATWPYRDELEARIVAADTNATPFRNPSRAEPNPMMVSTRFACTACHQER